MTFFTQAEEIFVRAPAGAAGQREALVEAIYEWNALNGRVCGVVFLPVDAEAGTGESVLTLLPGDSAGEGKAEAPLGYLVATLPRSGMQRGAGRPVTIAFESLAELKAAIQALLTECCGRGQSVPVTPLLPPSEFEPAGIARLFTRWEAEKANCPPTLGAAKTILRELDKQIDVAASGNKIDPLSLRREIGRLARYRVQTDQGQSYIQFWQRGDRVFERLARADHRGSNFSSQDEAAAGLEGCGR